MPVFFNSLPNCKNSNILIVVAFSNSPFSAKTSSPVTNLNLPTLSDDKAEIAVYLSKLHWTLFSLGTLNYDCDIKTSEMLSFLPLMNNSVTIGHNFWLASISAIISSSIINNFSFLC